MAHTSRQEEAPSSRLYGAVLTEGIATLDCNPWVKSEVQAKRPDGPRVVLWLDTSIHRQKKRHREKP